MNPFYALTGTIFFLYGLIFLWVGAQCAKILRHKKTSNFPLPLNKKDVNPELKEKKFSVIIPFRNEAQNLNELLDSLNRLNFSKNRFEVLFVDDHSEDDGLIILEKFKQNAHFSMRIISLEKPEEYGKKQALTQGVKQSKYPWIVTLDADSIAPQNWLLSIDKILNETSAEFVTGPVFFRQKKGLLFQFQASEFMALQALTLASFNLRPLLSNGTNLVYSKSIFQQVSGFSGNHNISSGDDMFLMRKIWHQKKWSLAYNADWAGAVGTKASNSWSSFAAQQLRWMSKTSALNDPLLSSVALIVFFTNFALVIWFFISLSFAINNHPLAAHALLFTALIFLAKFSLDHVSLWMSYAQIKERQEWGPSKINWPLQVLAAVIYPFWTLGLTLISLIYRPHWKGRKIQIK
jgi:biofilm PGA synthesis N-glycosyltransferase PgaC